MSEINLRFLPDIPPGWHIWVGDVEVAGTNHHIDAAIAFAHTEGQYLTLEPDPTNPHDPKAVKVLGWTQQRGFPESYFVGYVPKDLADVLPPEYQPRIKNIWLGGYHRPVVYIRFDVLVPKPPSQPKERNRKGRPQRERKVSAPLERPPVLQSPYLSQRPAERTYCEKCKAAHSGFDCPKCGNTHPGGGAGNSCDYCNTSYRESRRNCPVCTVEKHFKKAAEIGASGNLNKAIGVWWQGYDEARSNRLGFPYKAYFPYAAFLAEAGFGDDAVALLNQLRNHRRSKLAPHREPVDLWKYYRDLAAIHSAIARALALDPTPLLTARQGDIVFHLLLSELSERTAIHTGGLRHGTVSHNRQPDAGGSSAGQAEQEGPAGGSPTTPGQALVRGPEDRRPDIARGSGRAGVKVGRGVAREGASHYHAGSRSARAAWSCDDNDRDTCPIASSSAATLVRRPRR
jgi:hypothetical protein